LPSRLRFLALDALCIGGGAALGYLARSHAALLVPFFVGLTFGVGLALLMGRMVPLAGRHAAMAFTVAAALPVTFNLAQAVYLVGVFLLAAAARTVDYLIAGPLPRQPAAPLQPPSGHAGWLRFALAFAAAATAALWIGEALDPTHTIWVVATTLVVMQADARLSYRRIVERIAGTFAGVIAAWAITGSQSIVLISACILVVAPLIPHHLANRYWLHTALIALMILLVYDLAEFSSQSISKLLFERVIDMLLGCAIALVGTAAAFPRAAVAGLDRLVEGEPETASEEDPGRPPRVGGK
jgi:Fusaric acid resistance protein-like